MFRSSDSNCLCFFFGLFLLRGFACRLKFYTGNQVIHVETLSWHIFAAHLWISSLNLSLYTHNPERYRALIATETCCIFKNNMEIIWRKSMLASVFGTKRNLSWLMSSLRSVFWQITPKRCDVKQGKKRHKEKVDYWTQTAEFFSSSVHWTDAKGVCE